MHTVARHHLGQPKAGLWPFPLPSSLAPGAWLLEGPRSLLEGKGSHYVLGIPGAS